MAFWHQNITDKSFIVLQELRQQIFFILIGGWAVYVHTRSLKSKDIDIIVEFDTLADLKTRYGVQKNERLKKYEIPHEGFDIDIYVPGWSNLGIPVSFIRDHTQSVDGFTVPQIEIMILLKCHAYQDRKGSLKGKKDELDIFSILFHPSFDGSLFKNHTRALGQEFLISGILTLLDTSVECPELNLNQKQFADEKKRIKEMFKKQ
ncbi:hypothetical protein HY623_02875 [Candidatus Uhrbacteria bacterium]|nr:hypothetical protein [Candidatus Uhrbacteria bacterium]